MESDPAALVSHLSTSEGRRELQVMSIANTAPNLLNQLQKNGMPFLEAVEVTAPLFAQISPQEMANMPIRTQPELLWVFWLVKNNAVEAAKKNWEATDTQTLTGLGFDWAWTYGLTNVYLKPDQIQLQNHVSVFIQKLPKNIQRSVWELSQIEKIDNTNSKYGHIQKAWRSLFKELSIGLNDVANRPGRLPPGSAVAFIEAAQRATYNELVHFSQHALSDIVLPEGDFKRHKVVRMGEWNSSVGGLFLLAGSPFLSSTVLPNHSEVAPLTNLLDAMGLDINDSDTVRQLILKMNTPVQERVEMSLPQNVFDNIF